ncbi:Protein of unknown function [Lentzea albidocapillata subsp. violacea]|uniref:Uncharacterized protein n=1 Tax=Lentzea albidocapillata subsp. violacea TaxID=128104 RepID=A0A1G8U5P8_9PSEU|nr:DUF3040 domain-containing protein [Lentzea albidocapillata]SDJ49112.1 Protein of unknown function [Lentzea albidocapillata subsp. violacea]
MKLPDHEQQELDEIERHLAEDDPKLAAKLNRPAPRVPRRTAVVAGMLSLHVLGLLVVVAGVTSSSVVLVALGACLILGVFGGFAVRAWREREE